MFSEKGFSREQTDLFLKKVNFMENREYFFHKRRSMASRANAKDEDRDGSRDSSTGENQENTRIKDHPHLEPKYKVFENQNSKARKSDGRFFFDQLSSSCRLDDEQMRDILHKGPRGLPSKATNERRSKNYDGGMRQSDGGPINQRTSSFKRTDLHQR